MKCPLLKSAIFSNSDSTISWNDSADDCKEDDCAWWDFRSNRCAVLMVAVDMDRAVSVVNDLCIALNALIRQ